MRAGFPLRPLGFPFVRTLLSTLPCRSVHPLLLSLACSAVLLELCVIAMLCPDLSLERVYVIQHALVGASKKIEDNQPTNTRDESQESEPSGTPLAPGKPEHNKRSKDSKQDRRDK